MASASPLFSPFDLKGLPLPNRVVMAPMTRNRATPPDDRPNATMATYYAQRAAAGLLITEASQISPQGKGYPLTPGIHSPAQNDGWRAVTRAVKTAGGRIFLQLWHVGRISHPAFQPGGALPVAPSAIRPAGQAYTPTGQADFPTPRALATEELPALAADYAQAAKNAIAAGFDGVEIHGANGYLLDQFLRDGSNRRSDAYGGSVENRLRFPLAVVEAVTAAVEARRVGFRISPLSGFNDMRDSDPQALFTALVEALGRRGLAYVHLVEQNDFGPSAAFDFGALRRRFAGAWMVNGGYDRLRAERALSAGDADLVSFGVPFIANPDLVERLRRGGPFNAADAATFYGGDAKGYTDYPPLPGGA